MLAIKEVINNAIAGTGPCGTASIKNLSLQIIAEMNLLIPNVLVNFEDLNIKLADDSVNPYLQPAAKESLRRAIQRQGGAPLKISSAYRTIAQQHLLYSWSNKACGIGLAAKPSLSNHEDGLALDIPDFDTWRSSLEAEHWQWLGAKDKVHFTYMGTGVRGDIGNIGLQAFQQLWNKNNAADQVAVDGIWGSQTMARLNKCPAEGFGGRRLLKQLNPPMNGEDVRKIQQELVNASLLSADQVNSIYDQLTEAAVSKFQQQKGLSPDGIVGPQTLNQFGLA
jgi:hypothetical protein